MYHYTMLIIQLVLSIHFYKQNGEIFNVFFANKMCFTEVTFTVSVSIHQFTTKGTSEAIAKMKVLIKKADLG